MLIVSPGCLPSLARNRARYDAFLFSALLKKLLTFSFGCLALPGAGPEPDMLQLPDNFPAQIAHIPCRLPPPLPDSRTRSRNPCISKIDGSLNLLIVSISPSKQRPGDRTGRKRGFRKRHRKCAPGAASRPKSCQAPDPAAASSGPPGATRLRPFFW